MPIYSNKNKQTKNINAQINNGIIVIKLLSIPIIETTPPTRAKDEVNDIQIYHQGKLERLVCG